MIQHEFWGHSWKPPIPEPALRLPDATGTCAQELPKLIQKGNLLAPASCRLRFHGRERG